MHEEFHRNSAFKKLSARDPAPAAALIHGIVGKAEGVFLWVWLVVKDVLRGIRNRDSIPDLWDKVHALLKGLQPLYILLMSRLEPSYLLWASKAFQLERAVREAGSKTTLSSYIPDFTRASNLEGSGQSAEDGVTLFELCLAVNESLTSDTVCDMSHEGVRALCEETAVHIVARCACFLEVSSSMPNSKVRYLHRTARNFMEEPARWKGILSYTRRTSFAPYVRLMYSRSLSLRRLACGQIEHLLISEATRALTYAFYADEDRESHHTQVEILDYIDHVMTAHSKEGKVWYNSTNCVTGKPGLISSFVDFALFLNLSGYILFKTRSSYPVTGERATFLLHRRLKEHKRKWFEVKPQISKEMISVLVGLGADVNWKDSDDESIFELFFSCWFSEKNLEMQDSTKLLCRESPERDLSSPTALEPDTLAILKMMALAGADSHTSVKYDEQKMTIIQFIVSYLSPLYPIRAARILAALHRHAPSQKRQQYTETTELEEGCCQSKRQRVFAE